MFQRVGVSAVHFVCGFLLVLKAFFIRVLWFFGFLWHQHLTWQLFYHYMGITTLVTNREKTEIEDDFAAQYPQDIQ